MKKMLFIITIVGIALISGCLTYAYLEINHKAEYKNGVFVERENTNGYATVYSVCKTL